VFTESIREEDGQLVIVSVLDRDGTILELMERDGYRCTFPGCTKPFDTDPNGNHSLSLDHIYPQVRAKADGWTYEQINDVDNLQLMGRSCNAKKGDFTYGESGVLNIPVQEPRSVKIPRPEECNHCLNGRRLQEFETCGYCGSDPQPRNWPRWAKKIPSECSHGWTVPEDWCWLCGAGHINRAPASRTVFGVLGSGD
jgi:hypothetical protein